MNARVSASSRARAQAVTLARASARNLPLALAYVQAQTGNIDYLLHLNIALARARGLSGEVGHARGLARDLARHLAEAHALATDLGPAFTRNDALISAQVRDLVRGITRHLDCASCLSSDLEPALRRARASQYAQDVVNRDFSPALARIMTAAGSVYLTLDHDGAENVEPYPGDRVAPSACRLVAAAVWLLPSQARPRYREEYQSELWDLAHAGAGCQQQRCYALHQVAQAASLRIALLHPHQKDAGP